MRVRVFIFVAEGVRKKKNNKSKGRQNRTMVVGAWQKEVEVLGGWAR
jgi:hypothetical protein